MFRASASRCSALTLADVLPNRLRKARVGTGDDQHAAKPRLEVLDDSGHLGLVRDDDELGGSAVHRGGDVGDEPDRHVGRLGVEASLGRGCLHVELVVDVGVDVPAARLGKGHHGESRFDGQRAGVQGLAGDGIAHQRALVADDGRGDVELPREAARRAEHAAGGDGDRRTLLLGAANGRPNPRRDAVLAADDGAVEVQRQQPDRRTRRGRCLSAPVQSADALAPGHGGQFPNAEAVRPE